MKRLIDNIKGQACEVYAISHHERIKVGTAAPEGARRFFGLS